MDGQFYAVATTDAYDLVLTDAEGHLIDLEALFDGKVQRVDNSFFPRDAHIGSVDPTEDPDEWEQNAEATLSHASLVPIGEWEETRDTDWPLWTWRNPRIPVKPECQWFVGCDNAATTTRPHPWYGDVPICERCNEKVERL